MRRFVLLVLVAFLAFVLKPVWEEPVQQLVPSFVWDSIRDTVDSVKEYEEIQLALENLQEQLNDLLAPTPSEPSPIEPNDVNKEEPPESLPLATPKEQLFSIHNIELGDSRGEVEKQTGSLPERSSKNEYGLNWKAYHDNYHNFFMVMYDDEDVVRGLYTNQSLIASTTGIKHGSTKQSVQDEFGTPESYLRKGSTRYQIKSNGEYDIFQLDNSYVTVFYDLHKNDTVTAIKVIDKNLEESRPSYYSKPSQDLQEGFEYQLFDLTNASRVNHQLPILTWDDHVRETARKHSFDMAENQYFDHTNLQGYSPFDRMEADNIAFKAAGENLAYGQISSIFAHEGLMNSLGHRENTLRENYRYIGVGVAFNNESQPYFTKKFYTNSYSNNGSAFYTSYLAANKK